MVVEEDGTDSSWSCRKITGKTNVRTGNSSWTYERKNPSKNSWTRARLPREIVIVVLGDTQTLAGQVNHALKSRLGKVISRRPFQPEWLCFHLLFRNPPDLPVQGVSGKTKTFQGPFWHWLAQWKSRKWARWHSEQQPAGSQVPFRFLLWTNWLLIKLDTCLPLSAQPYLFLRKGTLNSLATLESIGPSFSLVAIIPNLHLFRGKH